MGRYCLDSVSRSWEPSARQNNLEGLWTLGVEEDNVFKSSLCSYDRELSVHEARSHEVSVKECRRSRSR